MLASPIINSVFHLSVIENRVPFFWFEGSSKIVSKAMGLGKASISCLSYWVEVGIILQLLRRVSFKLKLVEI